VVDVSDIFSFGHKIALYGRAAARGMANAGNSGETGRACAAELRRRLEQT
jgi:hypothetical protein